MRYQERAMIASDEAERAEAQEIAYFMARYVQRLREGDQARADEPHAWATAPVAA
jgi:hypothetical protein